MRHTRIVLAAAIAIAVALSGCSSYRSTGDTQAAPSQAASTPDPQTPTPTPTHPPGIVAHIKDAQGYTFDVGYVYQPHVLTKDIAGEAPGFNSIRIPLNATWSITNTTAGRDITFKSVAGIVAPLSDPMLSLAGLWPSTSDVCTYTAGPSSTPRPNGTCSIMLSFTRLPNTLSASQTVTPTAYAGYNGSDAGVAHVPDAKYDAVLAELKSPPAFSVRYSGGDMDRFKDTCPDTDLATFLDGQWVVNYATYAMFNAGFLPISATTGNCTASASVQQPPAK